MKTSVFILFTFLAMMCVSSCYNDKADKLYPATASTTSCDTSATISYENDIVPILQSYCYSPGNGCHDATGSATSGYDYTTYTALAGNAADGSLVSDINFAPTRGHNDMPKNGTQLPACDIEKIARWVNEGYPNN
jgi:hypothetical protein